MRDVEHFNDALKEQHRLAREIGELDLPEQRMTAEYWRRERAALAPRAARLEKMIVARRALVAVQKMKDSQGYRGDTDMAGQLAAIELDRKHRPDE